jgi:hypothetical protein
MGFLPLLRVRFFSALLIAGVVFCGASASMAQDSGLDLSLHANSRATANDIGLPVYPGAIASKDKDNDSAADLGLSFGDFHFTMKAVNYQTPDSPSQVFAFYRKSLARYGEVLECSQGKPVGALTVTHSGLTCSDKNGGHVQVNDSADSSSDHELRAGSPHKFRIVGIDESKPGATRFGLVYLELPKDSDSDSRAQ